MTDAPAMTFSPSVPTVDLAYDERPIEEFIGMAALWRIRNGTRLKSVRVESSRYAAMIERLNGPIGLESVTIMTPAGSVLVIDARPIEPVAGLIGPVDSFHDLAVDDRVLFDFGAALPPLSAVEREIDTALRMQQIERQTSALVGQYLLLQRPDGRARLNRSKLYSLARPDALLAAVRAHIATIARKHGPGRVWFLDTPVHAMTDYGDVIAARRAGDPTNYIMVRTIYGHEKQAQPEPTIPEGSRG